jgi:tRNA-specific 2-thiouridylase
VVAAGELLGIDAITGDHARWCGPAPQGVVSVGAQVRAHGEEVPATAWADGEQVEVRLQRRIRGVAPGQSVVLYDGTRVVGSATIARATTDTGAACGDTTSSELGRGGASGAAAGTSPAAG